MHGLSFALFPSFCSLLESNWELHQKEWKSFLFVKYCNMTDMHSVEHDFQISLNHLGIFIYQNSHIICANLLRALLCTLDSTRKNYLPKAKRILTTQIFTEPDANNCFNKFTLGMLLRPFCQTNENWYKILCAVVICSVVHIDIWNISTRNFIFH